MRVEAASSTTHSKMSESTGKRRKRYVYHPKYRSKLTFLIHVPGHSKDKCKVLGDLGTKYAKGRPTKDLSQEPATKNFFVIDQ